MIASPCLLEHRSSHALTPIRRDDEHMYTTCKLVVYQRAAIVGLQTKDRHVNQALAHVTKAARAGS